MTGRVVTTALRRSALTLGICLFALPLLGLIAATPWNSVATILTAFGFRAALVLSMKCSIGAAILSAIFGLPLASWLARGEGRLRAAVRALVTLPMVLPPVVGGVAVLLAFGRRGLIGRYLDQWFDVALPYTTAGVILATTFIAMPFFVLAAEAGMRSFDRRYSDVAATLGASPMRTFFTVELPMIAPSLQNGLVLAWARALGEFGATITFAGSLEGRTRTLPLAVYSALETDPEAAIVLSLLLVVVSVALLIGLRRHWFRIT